LRAPFSISLPCPSGPCHPAARTGRSTHRGDAVDVHTDRAWLGTIGVIEVGLGVNGPGFHLELGRLVEVAPRGSRPVGEQPRGHTVDLLPPRVHGVGAALGLVLERRGGPCRVGDCRRRNGQPSPDIALGTMDVGWLAPLRSEREPLDGTRRRGRPGIECGLRFRSGVGRTSGGPPVRWRTGPELFVSSVSQSRAVGTLAAIASPGGMWPMRWWR
jgi:hypothetical protein